MTAIAKQACSIEDYLAIDCASDRRHELVNGEIYAMTGGSANHALIAANLIAALGQGLRGQGRRHRGVLAARAAIALADVTQHAHLHRHDVELFACVLADLHHRGAARAGARSCGDIMNDIHPGQPSVQGAAFATGRFGGWRFGL